jgi:hypothetical protein
MDDSTQKALKEWVALDKEVKRVWRGFMDMCAKRDALEKDITRHVKQNGLEKLDINLSSGGKLVFKETVTYQNLSQKLVKDALTKHFRSDPVQAAALFKLILDNRRAEKSLKISVQKLSN